MKRPDWFERTFHFGQVPEMLPFFLERLEGTIPRLEAKTKALADGQLSHQPAGKWSIKQHIGHLAEVDEVALRRIDEILNEEDMMSPAVFDLKRDYNRMDVSDVLNYFRQVRLENLSRYSKLTRNELSKTSLHPRLKVRMSVTDLAYFDAEHDDHHISKITDIKNLFNSTLAGEFDASSRSF